MIIAGNCLDRKKMSSKHLYNLQKKSTSKNNVSELKLNKLTFKNSAVFSFCSASKRQEFCCVCIVYLSVSTCSCLTLLINCSHVCHRSRFINLEVLFQKFPSLCKLPEVKDCADSPQRGKDTNSAPIRHGSIPTGRAVVHILTTR